MQSENYGQLLDFAAHLWGIEPEYWDIWGRKHFTSNETKQAVLKGMGVRTGTAQSLRESIEARRRKEWTRLVPPCVVAGQQGSIVLLLLAPAELAWETARVEIHE